MAAAVADYTPAGGAAEGKIEKSGAMTMVLERTTDILGELGRARGNSGRPVLVGFAAQAGDVLEPARRKLADKRVDLIVANDVSAPGSGFDVETNQVTIVTRESADPLPLMSKADVAVEVLNRVEAVLGAHPAIRASS